MSTRLTLSDMNPSDHADPRPWPPTGDEMLASIARVSAERRANCRAFVAEFIEVYAADRTPEELDRTWVEIVQRRPWYAEDLLDCAEATLRNTDAPLPPAVCDVAQIEADGGEVLTEISEEQWQALGRRWLEGLLARFRPVFEELST
jgi:hypothetical protein